MHVIKVRNVHRALPEGIAHLLKYGVERDSRNGPVLVAPWPVTTHYTSPRERVIFWPERDANPFFHLMECLWVLAGRNDVAFLDQYVKHMKSYSDDGNTYHGAYGYRWLNHFVEDGGIKGVDNIDQLSIIIERLKKDPNDRRCVLTMWDPVTDLGKEGLDFPCNTQIFFSISGGVISSAHLSMTVCQRSGDLLWGVFGSNAVHFSFLLEYVAAGIGCKVGEYWQVTNNFHAYRNVLDPLVEKMNIDNNSSISPYTYSSPYPIVNTSIEVWRDDLDLFFYLQDYPEYNNDDSLPIYKDTFFTDVVTPIQLAHEAYRSKNYNTALMWIEKCVAEDWKKACREWLQRRKANFERAQDNGVNYEQS